MHQESYQLDITSVALLLLKMGRKCFTAFMGLQVQGVRRTPEGGMISVSPSFRIAWTVDRRDRLVVGLNDQFNLTVYGPDLKPEFRFLREYELKKSPSYSGEAWQNEFYPAFEGTIIPVDDDGNIWLEQAIPPVRKKGEDGQLEWERAPDHIYDIFSPEGIYLREITLPFRIQCIKRGKFYVLERDEEGYARVKRYRLE